MQELERLGAPDLGVILKIENRAAFERLPELMMTASKQRRVAVTVARGDLGVEIGFERLAEVQEEILWLAEAAQVPVIWATQVLESLAKDGLPSRAEVTDAAMSTRAECVMLNKGPYDRSGHPLSHGRLATDGAPHEQDVRNLPPTERRLIRLAGGGSISRPRGGVESAGSL